MDNLEYIWCDNLEYISLPRIIMHYIELFNSLPIDRESRKRILMVHNSKFNIPGLRFARNELKLIDKFSDRILIYRLDGTPIRQDFLTNRLKFAYFTASDQINIVDDTNLMNELTRHGKLKEMKPSFWWDNDYFEVVAIPQKNSSNELQFLTLHID